MLGMTRQEMLSKMSSSELSEWMAYARLELVGLPGFDYSKVKKPDDIPMTSQEQVDFFMNMVKALGKKGKKK